MEQDNTNQDLNIPAANNVLEFVNLLPKLGVTQLLGLAKLLGVKLLTTDLDPETKKAIPKDGMKIIEDCIVAFNELNRKQRRNLLKTMRAEVKEHGTSTEDRKEK